jgi:hypothetical protein
VFFQKAIDSLDLGQSVDLEQLESAIQCAEIKLTPSPLPCHSAASSNHPAELLLEIIAIRCDNAPGANKLLPLLSISNQFISRGLLIDAMEAGTFILIYLTQFVGRCSLIDVYLLRCLNRYFGWARSSARS